jgi:hypothetical protein
LAAALVPTIWVGLHLADKLFPKFDYGANAEFRRDIAGIHLGLGLIFLFCWLVAGIRYLRAAFPIIRTQKNRPLRAAFKSDDKIQS